MTQLNRQERIGTGLAAGSVLLIGGSVAASSLLGGYPVLGGQGSVIWWQDFCWQPGRGCGASHTRHIPAGTVNQADRRPLTDVGASVTAR